MGVKKNRSEQLNEMEVMTMFLAPYFHKRGDLAAWDPFREFADMERSFFGSNGSFKTDIRDTGDALELEADLPGFRKEDINIDVENGYLTISAERHSEYEDKDKQGRYLRCERSYGAFSRSFDTSGIDTDRMKAAFSDGVLRLTMPKQQKSVPESRRLMID